MINNNIKIIIISILMIGLLGGCNDWLDYQPKDKQSEKQQFSTKEGFFSTVNGVYNRMNGASLYGKYLSYEMIDVLGQRYVVNNTDEDDYSKYLRALQTWNYSDDFTKGALDAIWQEAYATIMNINVIIENIDKDADKPSGSILSERERKMLKGEMFASRAMIHFDLLRLFGPIYSIKPEDRGIPYNESTATEVLPILPANVVLNNYIIRDILAAVDLLKDSDPVITDGPMAVYNSETMDNSMRYRQLRLNYYASVLLLSRVYLWEGNYAKAAEYADILIDDPKLEEYFPSVDPGTLLANSVDPDRMFSTECLFGFYNKNRGLIYDNTFGGLNTGKKLLIPRPNYINGLLFAGGESSDYRYMSQWTSGTTLTGESSMQLIKFNEIIETGTGAPSGENSDEEDLRSHKFYATFCSMMKLSEAYYIGAEAYAELEDMTKAWKYLNYIRDTRGLSSISGDKKRLTDYITKEYIREFVGEGQIFFYFKRLNKGFDNDYNGAKEMKTEIIPGLPFYDYSDPANNETKWNRFVAPLPQSELDNR